MGKTQSRQNTIMNAIKKAPIRLEALVFDKPAQSGLIVTSVVIRKNQGAWDLEVKNPLHNHGPSLNAAAHHGHRKRDMHTGIFIIHLSTNSRC